MFRFKQKCAVDEDTAQEGNVDAPDPSTVKDPELGSTLPSNPRILRKSVSPGVIWFEKSTCVDNRVRLTVTLENRFIRQSRAPA
jgi:hypothetical protein